MRPGKKRKHLVTVHSTSMHEWQTMSCKLKRQKVTVNNHLDGTNVTVRAKPPEDRDGDGSQQVIEEDESLVRADQEACLDVKPAGELCCAACSFWGNHTKLVLSACRLHLSLDLASLLEAKLTGREVDHVLDYMSKRDYRDHPKVRILK